jgi:hypothetical protein
MSEEEWFVNNEDDIEDFKRSKTMTVDQLAALDDDEEDDNVGHYAHGGFNRIPCTTAAATTAAAADAAAAAAAVGQLVPFDITPLVDANAVRPEYAVVDNVSYYNLVSLWTLMYAQVTQGIVVPPVLTMGSERNDSVNFDF